jgi:flagellar hook protein FlgE
MFLPTSMGQYLHDFQLIKFLIAGPFREASYSGLSEGIDQKEVNLFMMRSMFSGVSGLRVHQSKMDVIGNNISNVNTVAFKSGRVTFEQVFSQTLQGASAPDPISGRGGTNPMQIGLGVGIASVDTIMTNGSVQRTDNPTDLAIEGDGFFIVKGGSTDTFRFTRAGNFGIDKVGNLVTAGGLNVYGWQAYTREADGTYVFDTEAELEPINLYMDDTNNNKKIISAKATTNAVISGNLDASYPEVETGATIDDTQFSVPMTVYDSLGNPYTVNLNFWKEEVGTDSTTWKWEVNSSEGLYYSPASGDFEFDKQGKIIFDSTTEEQVKPTIIITPPTTVGAEEMEVQLDFSKLTMFAADSSAKPVSVDGYSSGSLINFSIGSDGIITGIYSNGQQQPLGLIGLASFENPAGLEKSGNNLYTPTTNSGDFKKAVKAGGEGVGMLNPGTLEMSNVDLSSEFTEMIVTQRGFQANSRIITTSDEMLQELVNLKR